MSEVNIQVQETTENVEIVAQNNVIEVNITRQSGGGGGAVDSVNGQTGVVVLDADDISDASTTKKFVSASEKTAITHANRSTLDAITEAFTTALKTAYDSAVTWISTNGANLLNHLTNTSNPHNTTATQVDALQRDGSNANSNINIGEYELKAGQFTLDTSPTGTAAVGTTRWNDSLGSTETTLKGGSVILKNGVDLVARVVNKVTPNTTLTKANYPAVRISGAQGQRLAVAYAQANNDNNSADTIGLVCETIATNQEGFVITVGQLEGVNTTGSLQGETWSDGDVLYLSPTTAGRITNVKPTGAAGHIVVIGYVEYAHAVNGKIYVKIMNGWELDELHNVAITSPANNQGLVYETATDLWKNKTIDKSFVGLSNVDNTSDLNKPISTATQTALNGKISLNNWVDISLTSTIVGWASFTRREINVLDLGNCFLVIFALEGVSNSASATFTVTFTNTGGLTSNYIRITNNSTANNVPGNASIGNGSSTVVLSLNNTGGVFTASGNKSTIGEIIIYKTA